jgi:PAS domain S-box-containing protein
VVENIVEAMVDALFVVDIEGRILVANTAAAQLTGIARAELKNVPVAQLLVDDRSGMRTLVRHRIAEGQVLRREDSWLVHKDGSRVPVSVTAAPVLASDGELHGIVIVARDVRELRAAEAELRAAKASIEEQLDHARSQLVLAERRATLGTLAGGIGHELRNIGQILLSTVDELELALADPVAHRQILHDMLGELVRVTDHVNLHGQRLLHLARPGPDRVDPIDLNDVVRDVVAMLTVAGKLKRVDTTLQLAAEPLVVTVNRARIEQILVNLLVNAVDAIMTMKAPRGAIAIATGTTGEGRVSCSVTDDGCGVPADQLQRIFLPFVTTKSQEEGTGLGLPVAKEIVESYGGTLTVASTAGAGATFTFTLAR